MQKLYLFFALLFFMSSSGWSQQNYQPKDGILYVKKGATGNGSSWENAIGELADALKWAYNNYTQITESKPLNIYVSEGSYSPMYTNNYKNSSNNRMFTFTLLDNVNLYGGFTKNNNYSFDDRIIPNNTNYSGTILNGDLLNNDSTLEGANLLNDNSRIDNSYRILTTGSSIIKNIKIDGFTISGGNSFDNLTSSKTGGGFLFYTLIGEQYKTIDSKIDILNCKVMNNSSQFGGAGIHFDYLDYEGTSRVYSNIYFSNLYLINNYSQDGIGGLDINGYNVNLKLENSLIERNSSSILTGYSSAGGISINTRKSNAIVSNTIIRNNTSRNASAILLSSDSKLSIVNSTIDGNIGERDILKFNFHNTSENELNVINSNIVSNNGDKIISMDGGNIKLNILNSITYGNKDYSGMNDVSGNDLFNISNAKQKTTLYQNSLIQGRTSTNNSNIADIDLALPILFNSPSQQDYNLASNSPLINKGNNALYTGDITTDKDLAGKSRLSGTTIDIGAYEYVNTIPKVTSINRIGNEIVPASTMSIAYEVKFSEAVTGVDSSDFVLTSTGTAIGTVKNINGNGDTYIVTVHNLSGTGTLRLDLDATNTDITNILGASINESFTTGQVFIIDRDAPKVSTINVPADGTYKKDEVLDFIVTFNEKVNITGTPQLDLNIGTKTVQADYISGIGTTDLKFSYTVHATDLSLNGIAINGIKLNPNDKIEDEAGNNAILTLNSIPSTVGIIVIGTQADLMITASVDNLTIKYGETVTPTITVTNNGLDDATNVNVTAFLPTGFQYINSTNSGSYEEGKVNWKLPTLAKGENKTLIFQLKANKVVESATISATTSSDMYDPNESNNTASTAFEVKKADFSGLTFEDKTETFNGLSHAVIVNNLPIDAKVKYELSDEKGNKTENNSAINAGTYTVKATVSQENYTDWVETVKLTITSAPLTVTADTQTKVYGKNDPTLTYQITEGQLIGTDILTGELGRNIGENVGSYAITQGALVTNPNYDLTFISKNLTVTPAPLTITAKNADKTYDSLAYTGGNGIEYDGFVNNETESILIGSLIYSGNSQNAVNTGNYEIIPSGLNNNNYTITYVKGTLTISPAQITGITFSDESFTYDGSSKSIQIKGDLPTGTTVSYVGNNKTEVGTYGVLATIDGGINYQNQTLNANLKINQATISGITFSDKNFYYDGLPKSIEIKGALPTGTTVSYIGNGKTETGTHAVLAIIDGGNNYQNQTLNANLIINKSKITGITFNDESFLYDGTPKSIEIRGTLPTGATVSYTGNEQTEGGTYPITATIDGGDNYKSYVLHANLTIDLVFQTINWEEELVNMSPDEEKYISATSSSMLDVSFKSSDPAIAEVQYDKSKEKWILKAKKIGEVSITAHQEGNNNYFPAHPITQSLNIVPKLGLENDFLGDKYKRNLIIVPNPSRQRERFKLLADFSEKDLIGAKIIISDLTGKIYNEINKIERTTLIQAPLTANVYIVNLFLSDGRKASSKLLVK